MLVRNDGEWVNQVGLSRKHIFDAVEASVNRLGTYIDVLQIHRLDRATPAKEIMRALNDVIEKGWVRYIGASSMAAWEFQKYFLFFRGPKRNGLLTVVQSAMDRSHERLARVHKHAKLL